MENEIENVGTKYIPGVCNIGKAELNRRKNGVFLSLTLLVINVVILQLLPHDKIWNLTVFLTVSYFAISFQQWYFKFCVKFGLQGVFNFGDMGKTFTVEQQEFYKKDRAKAIKMISSGIIIGIFAAVIYYMV